MNILTKIQSRFTLGILLLVLALMSAFFTYYLISRSSSAEITTIFPTSKVSTSDSMEVCKTHPFVLQYMKDNEGSELRVGLDPGFYNELHTCVVTLVDGSSSVFPFRKVE